MDTTIYAYWNGQQLYDIFNAVVLVTGGSQGGNFQRLMVSIALVAFLVSVGVGLAKLRATDTVNAFMALTFFYGIFFIPTTTVYIDDVRKGTNQYVANVPYGLALFGGVTSHVGYWLTNTYETYFTAVDDEKFSKYGFLFGNRLIEELPKQDYFDPKLRGNLTEFVTSCVNPELIDNPNAIGAMVKSNDLWTYISTPGFVNPGRFTSYINPTTGVVSVLSCDAAVTALGADTLAGGALQLKYLGDKLHPGNPASAALIGGQLTAFESAMLGVSRTANETVRHYAMINMIKHANENQAAGIFASTMAASQLETSYFTMKTLAEGALPKIRNLIEALIYAVFPIVFLLVIAAGAAGGKVLAAYIMTAVWVQLWAPLFAVINSLSYKNAVASTLQLTGGTGSTIENMGNLLQMTVSDQAMAGLMVISVPAIALALVKGGAVAMSGVVNSVMSPAQSTAAKTGGEVGLGNIGGGNVNWGGARIGGTSVDRSTSFTTPQTQMKTPDGALTYDGQNKLSGVSPNEFGAAGASVRAERQDGGRLTDSSTLGARGAHGSSAEYQNTKQAGFTAQNSADFGRRLETALATRLGAEFRNTATDATGRHVGGDSRRGSGGSLSTDESARVASHLGLGGGGRDESFISQDGRSGTTYTQSGGGSTGRGAAPGGSGAGGSGGLPAKNGSVGPDVRHDNSMNRGRRVGGAALVNADVRAGTEASQRLSDIAKNENGQFTRNEQQWAAQTMSAAVNDVMKNTNDQGIRAAGKKFVADNGYSTRATTGEKASAEEYSDGSQRIERFGGATTGGALMSQKPVWDAALSMVKAEGYSGFGADQETMRRLKSDEDFRAEAVGLAMKNEGQSADGMTNFSDMPEPRSQESIQGAAQKRVDGMETTGDNQVAQTQARANGQVASMQPFSPNSMPNTTRAENEYGRVKGAAQERQANQAETAAFVAGSNNLAAQLYGNKEHSMSKVASIAYLGGMGYDSPSGYSHALAIAANEDPTLRAQISQYSNGKVATEKDLERIFDQVADKLK